MSIEEKLNAIKAINEAKEEVELCTSALSSHMTSAVDIRIMFGKVPEAEKRLMLQQYFQKRRLSLIEEAKELMK